MTYVSGVESSGRFGSTVQALKGDVASVGGHCAEHGGGAGRDRRGHVTSPEVPIQRIEAEAVDKTAQDDTGVGSVSRHQVDLPDLAGILLEEIRRVATFLAGSQRVVAEVLVRSVGGKRQVDPVWARRHQARWVLDRARDDQEGYQVGRRLGRRTGRERTHRLAGRLVDAVVARGEAGKGVKSAARRRDALAGVGRHVVEHDAHPVDAAIATCEALAHVGIEVDLARDREGLGEGRPGHREEKTDQSDHQKPGSTHLLGFLILLGLALELCVGRSANGDGHERYGDGAENVSEFQGGFPPEDPQPYYPGRPLVYDQAPPMWVYLRR